MLCAIQVEAQMHRYNTNFILSAKNFVDTIPIEFAGEQIYIPVTVNGRTYRFNLDTGSSQGMLYEGSPVPVVQHLGNVISHDANNVADTIGVVQLPPLTMGHLTVTGYVASMVKKPKGRLQYDGILGFDIFNKGLSAKIDPRRKIMILTDSKNLFDGEEGEALKYKLKWFVPYVLISPFMRHVDETLFDTGARQLYQINKDSFLEHSYKSKQVNAQVEGTAKGAFSIGTNGVEKTDQVYFLHLDRVKWGNFAFRDVHTITSQGASRFGAQVFNYGSIVILPRKKTIIFQPFGQKDSVSVSNRQFGVAFIDKDNQPEVGVIWHKSDAYRAGMRQGDIVLRINGQTISSYSDFLDFKFTDGATYTFILRDEKGFNKEVKIKR